MLYEANVHIFEDGSTGAGRVGAVPVVEHAA